MSKRNLAKLKEKTAAVVQRWVDTPYYDAVENNARSQWDNLILPFMDGFDIDYSNTMELSVGHGRMTAIMLEVSNHVIGVDVLGENLDFCRERFGDMPNLTLIENDGVTLEAIADDSVSFVFCFDSMIHFDSDVVRSYLAEFRRILKPGGLGFLHHSNLSRNPGGDFQRNPHARNFMSEALFRHYAAKEGLEVPKTQIINWGRGEKFVENLDCLSMISRPA